MAIIHQYDKRSDITYAYDSHSYWDKEKKMPRATRKLIGRVDPVTGDIVPTDGRNRKDKVQKLNETEPDYKAMYEKLQKKCASLEVLTDSLLQEIKKLKACR